MSRLTDDRSQQRVREEAEAIERILVGVRRGTLDWISSDALQEEIQRNPSTEKRKEVEGALRLASSHVGIDELVSRRARDLVSQGYGLFDALHVSAAEKAEVHVMLTTDDRLLRRAARKVGGVRIPLRNPLSWIEEMGLWQPWIN